MKEEQSWPSQAVEYLAAVGDRFGGAVPGSSRTERLETGVGEKLIPCEKAEDLISGFDFSLW